MAGIIFTNTAMLKRSSDSLLRSLHSRLGGSTRHQKKKQPQKYNNNYFPPTALGIYNPNWWHQFATSRVSKNKLGRYRAWKQDWLARNFIFGSRFEQTPIRKLPRTHSVWKSLSDIIFKFCILVFWFELIRFAISNSGGGGGSACLVLWEELLPVCSLFVSAYSTKMPFQSKIMKHTMLESYEQVQREVGMKTGLVHEYGKL